MKKKDPDLKYAYAYESQDDLVACEPSSKPKLDRMII